MRRRAFPRSARAGVYRIEPDGLPIGGDSPVPVLLVFQEVAESYMRRRDCRVEPDRLLVSGDGRVRVFLVAQGMPEFRVGPGIGRIEADRFFKSSDGPI